MEFPKIDFRYVKEAFKEPINFWGMAGFAIGAAFFQDVTPLLLAMGSEAVYLAVVPASPIYRRLVQRREKERARKLREAQREAVIKAFDPREREAVEYLRWMKNQIYSNYKKFTTSKEVPANLQTLDQRWEDFVDLLDVYRRRKHHLRSTNRQAVANQLKQAHELLGRIALAEKNYDTAITEFGQANQQNPAVLYLQGQAYKGKGDEASAKASFTKTAKFNSLPQINYAFVRSKAAKELAS